MLRILVALPRARAAHRGRRPDQQLHDGTAALRRPRGRGRSGRHVAGLAADLERGAAKPLYQAAALPGLDPTPLPDLDLIDPKNYSSMAIQYSRGCPFNCEFCDIIEIYGRKPRAKSPDPNGAPNSNSCYARKWRGSIFIVDDNFIGNKRKVKELAAGDGAMERSARPSASLSTPKPP